MFQRQPTPTKIFEDNQSAIALAENPVNHTRSKHIDVRYHYIRTCISNNDIQLLHVPTNDNTADIFTKTLPSPAHRYLTSKIFKNTAFIMSAAPAAFTKKPKSLKKLTFSGKSEAHRTAEERNRLTPNMQLSSTEEIIRSIPNKITSTAVHNRPKPNMHICPQYAKLPKDVEHKIQQLTSQDEDPEFVISDPSLPGHVHTEIISI
jgi:hypothetical protein